MVCEIFKTLKWIQQWNEMHGKIFELENWLIVSENILQTYKWIENDKEKFKDVVGETRNFNNPPLWISK